MSKHFWPFILFYVGGDNSFPRLILCFPWACFVVYAASGLPVSCLCVVSVGRFGSFRGLEHRISSVVGEWGGGGCISSPLDACSGGGGVVCLFGGRVLSSLLCTYTCIFFPNFSRQKCWTLRDEPVMRFGQSVHKKCASRSTKQPINTIIKTLNRHDQSID